MLFKIEYKEKLINWMRNFPQIRVVKHLKHGRAFSDQERTSFGWKVMFADISEAIVDRRIFENDIGHNGALYDVFSFVVVSVIKVECFLNRFQFVVL